MKEKKKIRPKSKKKKVLPVSDIVFDRPEPLMEGCFSSVRREHDDEQWMIEEREQRIFRAAGFPD